MLVQTGLQTLDCTTAERDVDEGANQALPGLMCLMTAHITGMHDKMSGLCSSLPRIQ